MTDAARKLLPCPKCKNEVEDLLKIDAGMRLALEKGSRAEAVLPQVCPKCYTELSTVVSQGAKLRAQKTSREYHKKLLWKNRVDFLKQARNLMSIRAYHESAIMYEKYLKSVAVGFETKFSDLTPDLFKDPRHRKELTLVTYVLWDLFKIYDSDARYKDRQQLITGMLIAFARSNNNIQADIVRKLKNYSKGAQNKPLALEVLKSVDKNLVRCFIATAAFDSRSAHEVQVLCAFRDQLLMKSDLGSLFVKFYYAVSPSIAQFLDDNPLFKRPIRHTLTVIATRLNRWLNLI